jgi:hypothetical protein
MPSELAALTQVWTQVWFEQALAQSRSWLHPPGTLQLLLRHIWLALHCELAVHSTHEFVRRSQTLVFPEQS